MSGSRLTALRMSIGTIALPIIFFSQGRRLEEVREGSVTGGQLKMRTTVFPLHTGHTGPPPQTGLSPLPLAFIRH